MKRVHACVAGLVCATTGLGNAYADVIATTFDPATGDPADIVSALLGAGSGLTVVPDSVSFIGASGQAGLYSGFGLAGTGLPSLSLGDGVVMTTGSVADLTASVNDSANTASVVGTGSNAALSALLQEAGAPSSVTNDQNVLTFDFTLDDPSQNAIELDFVFGSEEFPDQGVTDAFAVFVDGTNYAFFEDGSLVTFVAGANDDFFNDNTSGGYDIELDGLSDVLTLTGLIDTSIAVHTLSIVIADTADAIFDSAVFITGLSGSSADGGGGVGVGDPVPLPAACLLFPAGAALMGAARGRRSPSARA